MKDHPNLFKLWSEQNITPFYITLTSFSVTPAVLSRSRMSAWKQCGVSHQISGSQTCNNNPAFRGCRRYEMIYIPKQYNSLTFKAQQTIHDWFHCVPCCYGHGNGVKRASLRSHESEKLLLSNRTLVSTCREARGHLETAVNAELMGWR